MQRSSSQGSKDRRGLQLAFQRHEITVGQLFKRGGKLGIPDAELDRWIDGATRLLRQEFLQGLRSEEELQSLGVNLQVDGTVLSAWVAEKAAADAKQPVTELAPV